MKKETNFNRDFLMRISALIKFDQYEKIIELLESKINLNPEKTSIKNTWENESFQFIQFLKACKNNDVNYIESYLKPELIFNTQGNSKLKFLSFSNLPIVNCIGSGACEKFCYSLKAWRYPRPFFKQARNTILTQNYFNIKQKQMPSIIKRHLKSTKKFNLVYTLTGISTH